MTDKEPGKRHALWLSAEDRAVLQAAADADKLNLSAFIKRAALKEAARLALAELREREENARTAAALAGG